MILYNICLSYRPVHCTKIMSHPEKRPPKEYGRFRRSGGSMAARLARGQIGYAVRARKREERAADIAMRPGVSARHVYRLWERPHSPKDSGDASWMSPASRCCIFVRMKSSAGRIQVRTFYPGYVSRMMSRGDMQGKDRQFLRSLRIRPDAWHQACMPQSPGPGIWDRISV